MEEITDKPRKNAINSYFKLITLANVTMTKTM